MRIDRITLVNNVNKELGCYTVSIKVLDNTESVSVPKVSNNEWSLKGKMCFVFWPIPDLN